MKLKQIGKGGIETSFVVGKNRLKKILKGGTSNCQQNIDKDIDNKEPGWLQLTSVLQNISGKGIASMIANIDTKDVVVKVQVAENAALEYQFQQQLQAQKGFIHYQCYFTCAGDKSYIEQFSNHKKTLLCTDKGVSMGVIVMPYYPRGSLEDCLKQKKVRDIKTILVNTIKYVFGAFVAIGFTHGDLFTKNILLDNDDNPIMIDFEKSRMDKDQVTFWRDIDDLLGDVSRFVHKQSFDDISRVIMINRAYNVPPNDQNITDLVHAIQGI
jgi:serine/threonine protein kinase